ncbi:copper chaperone PCu(A)C [Pseudomonas gingeri NCPPB 3146 = LMG 5327]|uniref:Copper chaperone PCu(A)C n=2 Tax=Pseudomonas gingeri TaxID=117681 RepID=A0A7Y7XWY0_9PSED|nr:MULTISPECIES: copper chaperone PCu(A)C [Pseudomonas]NVZ24385.1 copper chaperone PCu(A)C [Pseudomonas gingeri]NVZ64306.1 copper chaperone PCu(A)C [Pseudomonas gingeri]NVZ78388.1 copper chaperone PCu(A)C [Pseudomonas gingeri]NWC13550.1 copper chaperone PCu(A)C [Pseudomonas gingeri]NWE49781.1 copper chaperone PCu(A)C [Pseudomonas gingeri]
MNSLKYIAFSILGTLSLHASAQTLVEDAWVRATVPGQPSTGAFMRITSTEGGKLLEARSPVAKTVQIHESKMQNDIMSMEPVDSVALPAGKAVSIDPEGYHVMLIDLVGQVKEGDSVPLTLVVENAKGVKESVEVKATARALNEMPMHDHGDMH